MIINYKYMLICYTCRPYDGIQDLLKAVLQGVYNKKIKSIINNAHTIELRLIKPTKSEAEARRFKKKQIKLYQPDLNVHKKFNVW